MTTYQELCLWADKRDATMLAYYDEHQRVVVALALDGDAINFFRGDPDMTVDEQAQDITDQLEEAGLYG